MKKLLSLSLLVCLLLTLASCGAKTMKPDGAKTMNPDGANKLHFGEKYVHTSTVGDSEDSESYYLFEKDTLIYYYHSVYIDNIYHYTVTYRYEVMGEGTIAYFFDSVVIHDDDNQNSTDDFIRQSGVLLFSENVLIKSWSNSTFVRESYLEKELPNFGKE